MKFKFLMMIIFLFSGAVYAEDDDDNFPYSESEIGKIVHGPFDTDLFKEGKIYFYLRKDLTVDFYLEYKKNNEIIKKKIDNYPMEGEIPKIRSVFFHDINGVKNVVVLVGWKANHMGGAIYGAFYEVYAYEVKDTTLVLNKKLEKLSGMEGRSDWDQPEHFKYKTASAIKQYLKEKY